MRRRKRQRRRGTLYIAVMGVGLIVSVIALTASSIGRIESRAARAAHDQREAQLIAASAIEQALAWMNHHTDWRQTLTSGVEVSSHTLGSGEFTWSVTDTDGNLSDDARDHATLRGIGRVGDAIAVEQATIEPAGRALTSLEVVAYSEGNFLFNAGSTFGGSGILSGGSDINANGATVDLDCEATGNVNGTTYNGTTTSSVLQREMPGDHAFDYYLNRGTTIDINDLPTSGSTRKLEKLVLGPQINPFGETNPWGIYVIDCQGESIRITRIRLSGTLVLLDVGSDSEVKAPLMLDPTAPNQPALLVNGDIKIGTAYTFFGSLIDYISESFSNTNFNPATLPYNGESDDAQDDEFPSRITGGIYATGTVTFHQDCEYEGFVVANGVQVDDSKNVTATYHPYALNYPPVGFSAGQGVRLIPGSRQRAAY